MRGVWLGANGGQSDRPAPAAAHRSAAKMRPPHAACNGDAAACRLLATWLASYYAGASATPSILGVDMMDSAMAGTGEPED